METQKQQPLYKRLNEVRTQGKWELTKFNEGDFGLCMECAGDGISEQMKKEDAEYTALAVNNLASLAEALELLYELCNSGQPPGNDDLDKAKEALSKIS